MYFLSKCTNRWIFFDKRNLLRIVFEEVKGVKAMQASQLK